MVLNCLAGNLILYLCYYLLRKKCCHTTEAEYIKEKYKEQKWELTSKCSIPALISPGTFFTFLALVFAVIGKNLPYLVFDKIGPHRCYWIWVLRFSSQRYHKVGRIIRFSKHIQHPSETFLIGKIFI